MANDTLTLIMAAGKGSRVKYLLEEDEPIKPMIKYAGRRLIEHVLDSASTLNSDIAVLSFESPAYESLDELVTKRGLTLLKQKARRGMPIPYVLARQYHWSSDSGYLKKFGHILMMPSDVILEDVHLPEFYQFHINHIDDSNPRQVTMLCKDGDGYPKKADLLKMEGDRAISLIRHPKRSQEGYISSYQSGTHLITKEVFEHPAIGTLMKVLGCDFQYVRVIRYPTQGKWKNFGEPEDLLRYRAIDKKI